MKIFFGASLICATTLCLCAETSMFGAGDLNSPTPYGLSQTEKIIVKNKQAAKENEKRIKKVDSQLQELYERTDALQSVFDGESVKINDTSKQLMQLSTTFENYKQEKINLDAVVKEQNDQAFQEIKASLENLQFQINNNKENIKILKEALDQVTNTVNDINKNYVLRDEFKKEFDGLIKVLDEREKKKVKQSKSSVEQDSGFSRPNKELMQEARDLFKKDYFTQAIPILEYLVSKRYRPAECNYYLGEINYYRKNYQTALDHFKKSMLLYDKAKYIPKLLLHSAISFENIGDTQNAQKFYQTLVSVYPDSTEAKQASKKIK